MSNITIGDLARHFQTRRQTLTLKTDLDRLTGELASGLKSDLSAAVSRDFGPIAGIERALSTLVAHRTATTEAAGLVENMQLSLEAVQNIGRDLSPSLLSSASTQSLTMINSIAVDVREKFGAAVSALNARSADRSLLAGAATDGPALLDAPAMMAQLTLATSAETTAAGIIGVVEDWFDMPGGGFETLGYLGSADPIGPLSLRDGTQVGMTAKADDPAIRDTLKAYALGALIAEGALAGDHVEQVALIEAAGMQMIGADDSLTVLRAGLGAAEARIEDASVRLVAEATALEIARSDLVAADPYDTASELEAVYSKLETLYTVTSHLARLNFTDYMR